MKIPLYIEIDDMDENVCGRDCPFLRIDACQLFGEDLSETQLPDTHCWQDDTSPTRDRCYDCSTWFNKPEE